MLRIMDNITKVLPQSKDEWLKLRQQSIGGSDAATIVGLNDYSSPYALWVEKTGKLIDKEDNEAMRQGRDLEEYVARRFTEETGKQVEVEPNVIKNSKFPFAHATIDRKVTGENAGLECKTVSSYNWNKYRKDGFPYYYYVQCLHYMAVCDFDKYYLAVLVLGRDFKVFEFERDPETQRVINDLMQSERDFWKLVEDKTPPDMDGSQATDEALLQQFDPEEESPVMLLDMDDKAQRLNNLKLRKKDIETDIRIIEQEIKEQLGNSMSGTTRDFQFSWKPETRRTFQVKAFSKDNPDIDLEPYYKTSEKRVFRVKEITGG